MKNKLSDLNNHLFTALERINAEDLNAEDLKPEIARARAVAAIGKEIIENAKARLDAQKFAFGGSLPINEKLPGEFNDTPKLEAIPSGKK